MSTLSEIRSIAADARSTLRQDAFGAIALMVMLVVGLHMPSFF